MHKLEPICWKIFLSILFDSFKSQQLEWLCYFVIGTDFQSIFGLDNYKANVKYDCLKIHVNKFKNIRFIFQLETWFFSIFNWRLKSYSLTSASKKFIKAFNVLSMSFCSGDSFSFFLTFGLVLKIKYIWSPLLTTAKFNIYLCV